MRLREPDQRGQALRGPARRRPARRRPRPEGDRLTVAVTDDGRGGATVGHGSGLVGLRQRVTSVDGDLHVRSPAGQGTTVTISLPMRPRRTR
ncbi:ATP-binding protein [Ornithinimicrobium avium]|uniref:ATP-binding protein n=1 Tax=Ornithinimicrobium avium TaxID=2283195 RepID=UPI0038991A77